MIKIPLLENYLDYLYSPEANISKEIQGPNLPVERDNKPNWIGECMVIECNKEKINCLRRLKEMTAMNPFYQYRIDRFIDAITQTYEPTEKPGYEPDISNHQSGLSESKQEPLSEFVVTAAVTTAYKIYQRYFSKAAKKCEGLPGKGKTVCIIDEKIKGMNHYKKELKKVITKCKRLKKMIKCQDVVKKKIKKVDQKIQDLKKRRKKYA